MVLFVLGLRLYKENMSVFFGVIIFNVGSDYYESLFIWFKEIFVIKDLVFVNCIVINGYYIGRKFYNYFFLVIVVIILNFFIGFIVIVFVSKYN